jgi:putative endonuclease
MKAASDYYVYILTNRWNRVLYTGVTNDLIRRVWEHREKAVKGFTERFNVYKLVYFEVFSDPLSAITREKQIKGGSRRKKLALIRAQNPEWNDLYGTLV